MRGDTYMGHFSPSGIGSRKHRHLRHHLLLGLLQVLPQEFHLIINADGERSFPHNSKQVNMGRVLVAVLLLALVSS